MPLKKRNQPTCQLVPLDLKVKIKGKQNLNAYLNLAKELKTLFEFKLDILR